MNRWLLQRRIQPPLAVGVCSGQHPRSDMPPPAPLNAATLTKYIDPLPVPPVALPSGPGHYDMTMLQGTTQFSSQFPATPVWGYGGGYLGPTIEASPDQPITASWINRPPDHAPARTFIDYTLDGSMQGPDVRAVTHLHGGHVAPDSDGGPDAWFSPGQQRTYYVSERPGRGDALVPRPRDGHHPPGTRSRVWPASTVSSATRTRTHSTCRKGAYEIPLVIQDKLFNTDGTLTYPGPGNRAPGVAAGDVRRRDRRQRQAPVAI